MRLGLAFSLFSVPATTFAQAPAAGSNWEHLKALPLGTHLHVSADHGGATCKLVSVDDSTLICGKHNFQRADVKKVKLSRYGTSYLAGAGIGAGVGAVVGLGISAGTDDAFFKNDKASFAGVGAALGAIIGLAVTGPADLFRGPSVYTRQSPAGAGGSNSIGSSYPLHRSGRKLGHARPFSDIPEGGFAFD